MMPSDKTTASDNDDYELLDEFFIPDISIIPNSTTPTQLPAFSNRLPPVRPFGRTRNNSSPTNFLATHKRGASATKCISGINVLTHEPEKKSLSFKNYLKIFSAVLAGIILLSSIALLILSILTPSLLNSIFSPALNILQTQIICGFGIVTGATWGIMQIKKHYNYTFDDYNDITTNNNLV